MALWDESALQKSRAQLQASILAVIMCYEHAKAYRGALRCMSYVAAVYAICAYQLNSRSSIQQAAP